MTARWVVALCLAAPLGIGAPACAARPIATTAAPAAPNTRPTLDATLDDLLNAAALRGAAVAVHIESLADGRVLYSRHADARMVPASTLKILTAAVAAERLGWSHRFHTRLEATGPVRNGVLDGDLIVVGDGDPAINAQDLRAAPVFDAWAGVLRDAGIVEVRGRLIGDDRAFTDEPLGAGWAWDYLTAAYAAPSGALSYNENLVAVRVSAGARPDEPARVDLVPPGHGLTVRNAVRTTAAGTPAVVTFERVPGETTLTVRGQVPAGGPDVVRATTVVNPTRFFVDGFAAALAARGIHIRGGTMDIGEPPNDGGAGPVTVGDAGGASGRRILATHASPPLSSLVAQMLKTSQNFYGENLIKAIGRTAPDAGGVGSTAAGRRVIEETLEQWGLPVSGLVMYDGSGLSRYNYASTRLLTGALRRMWEDPTHRGPFAAALPVAGHDGTLGARMTDVLRRRVQAKTGTIANVRSLAGYAEAMSGERLVFAMIANHFVAPNAEIDRVMEDVLREVISGATGATGSTGDTNLPQ